VEQGELFFDTPDGEKSIVDVRSYWDNVPQWEETAKLLYTPTLDYEQELMYLPQYSKTDFVNMEIGFNSARPMIGSRMLVYNPGDLPIEWEIRFDENKRSFWSCRGGTKFRIRRFNVERLKLENAVDWCGLTTYEKEDDRPFRYGNKYFKRRSSGRDELIKAIERLNDEDIPEIYKPTMNDTHEKYNKRELIQLIKSGILPADKNWGEQGNYRYSATQTIGEMSSAWDKKQYKDDNSHKVGFNLHLDNRYWADILTINSLMSLGKAHPHHCYYVEPIPR
jgi:hypothetical protein